jgi:hypothetical protein
MQQLYMPAVTSCRNLDKDLPAVRAKPINKYIIKGNTTFANFKKWNFMKQRFKRPNMILNSAKVKPQK